MSVNSKMTAIADPIRSLMGLSGTLGLDAMATNLGNANTEVSSQSDLIAQIVTALEGKTGAAGGGGGGVEFVTGTLTPAADIALSSATFDFSGLSTYPTLVFIYKEPTETVEHETRSGIHAVVNKITSYEEYQWDASRVKSTGTSYLFACAATSDTCHSPGVKTGAKSSDYGKLSNWPLLRGSLSTNFMAGETYRYYAFAGVTV